MKSMMSLPISFSMVASSPASAVRESVAALVVAEDEGEEACLVALKFGIGVGEGLDGLVEVLALPDVDDEVEELLFGLGGGVADVGVGMDVAHEDDHLRVVLELCEGLVEGGRWCW